MPKTTTRNYRIIRGYNNQYGLETFIRRLIRHHIDTAYLPDKSQENPSYGGNEHVRRNNN